MNKITRTLLKPKSPVSYMMGSKNLQSVNSNSVQKFFSQGDFRKQQYHIHPEQLMHIYKANQAHRICNYIDSRKYQNFLISLANENDKLIEEISSGVTNAVEKYHKENIPKHKKKIKAKNKAKPVISETVIPLIKSKIVKTTVLNAILKKKQAVSRVVKDIVVPQQKPNDQKKISTILPVVLKKRKKPKVKPKKQTILPSYLMKIQKINKIQKLHQQLKQLEGLKSKPSNKNRFQDSRCLRSFTLREHFTPDGDLISSKIHPIYFLMNQYLNKKQENDQCHSILENKETKSEDLLFLPNKIIAGIKRTNVSSKNIQMNKKFISDKPSLFEKVKLANISESSIRHISASLRTIDNTDDNREKNIIQEPLIFPEIPKPNSQKPKSSVTYTVLCKSNKKNVPNQKKKKKVTSQDGPDCSNTNKVKKCNIPHKKSDIMKKSPRHLIRLPKTTPEGYRVMMYSVRDPDPTKLIFNDAIKGFCMYNDCVLSEDGLQEGYVVVFDMKGVALGHLARVSLPALRCFMAYIQEAHPARLKSIHILNTASWIHHIMRIIIPLVKSEMLSMIKFHKGQVPDDFPLEILPMDYGGEAPVVADLDKQTKTLLTKYGDWVKETEYFKANEDKRVKKATWWGFFNGTNNTSKLDEKTILKNLQID